MNHAKTPAYLRAIKAALKEIEDGHAISYCTGRNYEAGRYITLLTAQGWNPEPFWREIEKAAEPPTFAILRYRSGREVDRIMLTDSDPLDCDHFAERFSKTLGYELEGETEGRIPDGCEDYSITITDDPEGVRCWSSANYMLKPE
jgi:hypothetical protein